MLKPNLKARVWSAFWLLKQKPDLLFFSLLVLFLPSQLGLHFWPDWALVSGIRVDYLSPTIFLTDIFVFLLALSWLPREKLTPGRGLLFVLGGVLLALINIYFSLNWQIALYKWMKVLEMAFVALYVYRNKEIVKGTIAKLLIIPLAYSLALGIFQVLNGGTIGGLARLLGERTFRIATPGIALANILGKSILRPYASFPHPNVLGGFGLVAFLLGANLGLPLVVISFSQGAWIAAGLVLLTKKFFTYIHRQLLLGLLLVSILLMPVGHIAVASRLQLPESIDKRLILAGVAGEALARSPVIGIGLGNFIPFIPESRSQKNLWFLQPVHNIFLLVLSETGAVGLVFFYLLVLRILKKSPTVLAIVVTGMFDHYWLTLQQPLLLFAIVIGILF